MCVLVGMRSRGASSPSVIVPTAAASTACSPATPIGPGAGTAGGRGRGRGRGRGSRARKGARCIIARFARALVLFNIILFASAAGGDIVSQQQQFGLGGEMAQLLLGKGANNMHYRYSMLHCAVLRCTTLHCAMLR
jgi:hypothetical protein